MEKTDTLDQPVLKQPHADDELMLGDYSWSGIRGRFIMVQKYSDQGDWIQLGICICNTYHAD